MSSLVISRKSGSLMSGSLTSGNVISGIPRLLLLVSGNPRGSGCHRPTARLTVGVAGPSQVRDGLGMPPRTSAGILLFRPRGGRLEVLLAHPGGPFFRNRDEGHWTIPKGEADGDEGLVDVRAASSRRRPATRRRTATRSTLGTIVQKGGKVVHAWALEGDLDPAAARATRSRWCGRRGSAGSRRSRRSTGSSGSRSTRRGAGSSRRRSR